MCSVLSGGQPQVPWRYREGLQRRGKPGLLESQVGLPLAHALYGMAICLFSFLEPCSCRLNTLGPWPCLLVEKSLFVQVKALPDQMTAQLIPKYMSKSHHS